MSCHLLQAPADAVRGTVEALGSQLRLSHVFRLEGEAAAAAAAAAIGVDPTLYELRSVVCFSGHHYRAYALSEELPHGQWLLFDDDDVELVGGWQHVCRAMAAQRLQPSLLFFQRAAAGAGGGGGAGAVGRV